MKLYNKPYTFNVHKPYTFNVLQGSPHPYGLRHCSVQGFCPRSVSCFVFCEKRKIGMIEYLMFVDKLTNWEFEGSEMAILGPEKNP